MCWCTPEIRTPNCGKINCHPPVKTHKSELEEIIGENMMGALTRYINDRLRPGDFLSAVLSNDLKEACGRADHHNKEILFEYVNYLYNYCPAACWGSYEKVNEWLKGEDDEEPT